MPLDRAGWSELIGKIAWRIGQGDFPSGSLAELRRLNPDAPDGAAFWRLVVGHADALADDPRALRVLAAVLRTLPLMKKFHAPNRPLGQALAECKVKDPRLLRLLRLGSMELPEELRRLARLLVSKGEPGRFDWTDAAMLLWTAGTPGAQPVRAKIALDFYRAEHRQGHQQDEIGEKAA